MGPLDFDALKDMHNSANDLLHSPMVQQALLHQREEKWFSDFSESSLRMLEVCGITKDVLLLVKEHLQELQFTSRRASIGEQGIEDKITACNCYRKKLKKKTSKCLKWLKGKTNTITLDPPVKDQKLMLVVDVLREVRVTSISIVESLLFIISTPWLDSKSGKKWSFTSKLVRVSFQSSSDDYVYDAMELQSANKRLAGVQMAIEDIEAELECMFRRLIHTRALLLNILTN